MASGSQKTKKKTTASARTGSSAKGRTGSTRTGKSTKNTAGRGNAKKASSKKSSGNYVDYAVGVEIRIVLVLAVSVLLMLGNFKLAGRFGRVTSGALFGVFGLMAYAFPVILFLGYAFFVANRRNSLLARKMLGLILMVLFVCAFIELLTNGYMRNMRISEFYEISSEDRSGGGILGGFCVWVAGYIFGSAGAWTITVFGLIISAIILTQKPLLGALGSGGRKAAGAARLRRQERSRKREEAREEYERLLEEEEEEELLFRRSGSGKAAGSAPDSTSSAAHAKTAAAAGGTLKPSSVSRRKDGNLFPDASISDDREAAVSENAAAKPNADASAREQDPLADLTIDGQQFRMPSFLMGNTGRSESTAEAEEAREETIDLEWNAGELPSPENMTAQGGGAGESSGKAASGSAGRKKETASSGPETSGDGITSADHAPEEDPSEEASPAKLKRSSPAERQKNIDNIALEIKNQKAEKPQYELPSLSLLAKGKAQKGDSREYLRNTAAKLQQTLQTFGVNVKVVNVSRGPTVTRFELQPEMGVKVSKILSLQDDIQLNLATSSIRIEAPIPGKAAVGIEIPNRETSPVMLRDMLESDEFKNSRAQLPFAVGKDLSGKPVITDIEKMPHVLIAGATGSGKSVCINTLIMSILFKASPDQVKMLMIDPKVVELKVYDGIPHLLIPVVTDAKKAAGALNWAVQEMTERYNKFAAYPGVRDIRSYNERVASMNAERGEGEELPLMPRIVVIVDELADLMMVASSEVEDAICRLAQLARAAGIHLVIATQRPSVNVVTGLIKANMPSRIALSVSSGTDSRTIIDMNGAEKLLGNGDMLFYPQGYPKPARVQGSYVSDEDITEVVKFLTSHKEETGYNKEVQDQIDSTVSGFAAGTVSPDDERDEYFAEAGRLIIEKEKASIGMLQRAFKIGFNRAARIMDQLSEAGVVGGEEGTKPRRILMTLEEFEELLAA